MIMPSYRFMMETFYVIKSIITNDVNLNQNRYMKFGRFMKSTCRS